MLSKVFLYYNSLIMLRLLARVPRFALIMAGVLAGTVSVLLKADLSESAPREQHSKPPEDLERRMASCERRLEEHEARLNEVPGTAQIVSAMEDLLAQTMNSIDQRLSDHLYSIETLKSTVAKSDELMERVLESIYALQDPAHENIPA